MGGRDQAFQRVEPAEQGIDVAGIGDVVAVVGHRRDRHRAEPDRVDAQGLQVVEVLADAVEVTDAVTVAVAERSRIDLIEDGVGPPRLWECPPSCRNQNGELTMDCAAISRYSMSTSRCASSRVVESISGDGDVHVAQPGVALERPIRNGAWRIRSRGWPR